MWTPIQNIVDNARGMMEFVSDNPARAIKLALAALVLALSAWDIFEGSWVSHTGKVTARTTSLTSKTVCDARNAKDECTASHTEYETVHYTTVSHEGEIDVVKVNVITYMMYGEGSLVQISYREGGVLGIHWFCTISAPKADF
jgi:hypothetical protein